MATLMERVQANTPQAIPVEEIPKTVELAVKLQSEAHDNYRARFQGALDDAATVRVKVYVPAHRVDQMIGGKLTFTDDDVRAGGWRLSKDRSVAVIEFEDPELGITAIFYAPAKAEVESLSLSF